VKELAIFCRQFAVMNAAGIHLLQSLHDLREQTTDRLLQKIISEAVVSLEKGKSLTEAFMINSGSLPPIYDQHADGSRGQRLPGSDTTALG